MSARAEHSRPVTEADTAAAFGAQFPPAASTPFVLGLAEVACHAAVADRLGPEEITVGTRAVIDHLAPTAVGATLTASALLLEGDGRRLRFAVEIHDGDTLAARIEHTRAIVARPRVLARLGA